MNKITEWSYEKPTEPGDYLCCFGDVETPANVHFERFYLSSDILVNKISLPVRDYHRSVKFARLIYAPSELKELENE